ncbi:hypothetical protein Plim_3589 [Planctopirus limnophila DSM 3776]|uniref:Uncharacterized protein n=1 Tax=Planctopirus limnophila (strain ATCC 43296 / DSM 3776 / IFAM 1008 / Mu 290) TaxID=521674 RepID=D5SVP2_PLAL2|nr:hypothetical protein [Planctopirus limnophila]ADG69402.1 hypothetical protein Plim_3589 [Planctopirus limnophila DSM 3776]
MFRKYADSLMLKQEASFLDFATSNLASTETYKDQSSGKRFEGVDEVLWATYGLAVCVAIVNDD